VCRGPNPVISMGGRFKSKKELLRELEETRQTIQNLEACRIEFAKVEERYRNLVTSAPDALVFCNPSGQIVLVNAQAERVFGYSEAEMVGQPVTMLVPDKYRDRHAQFVNAYFENPEFRPMGTDLEIYGVRKNGEEFPADISLSPLETEEGLLAAASIRDVTDRKRFQDEIELNYHIQRVINQILKVSLEPVSLGEQMDRILDLILSIPGMGLISKGAIYFVDTDTEELVLQTSRGFGDDDPIPCRTIPSGNCLCGKAALHQKVMYAERVDEGHSPLAGGQYPHGHYCVPIISGKTSLGLLNLFVREGHKRNAREEEFLVSVANTVAGIIERTRSEAERQRLLGELSHAETMAALGRLTANVAHQIRNPLTVIGGFARRLHEHGGHDEKELEYTEYIFSEAKRLERILANVLTYSVAAKPKVVALDIRTILDDELRRFGDKFGREHILAQTRYNDIPFLCADGEKVRIAVENLLSNAADAMPTGGKLLMETLLERVNGDRYFIIRITDTGGGIEEKDLAHLFEPFFTTKVAQQGIGLGLAITKRLVEDHGGFITVTSGPERGAAFSLYFPIHEECPPRESRTSGPG